MLNIYQQVLNDIWHIFNGKFSLYHFKINEKIQYAQIVNNTHYIREQHIIDNKMYCEQKKVWGNIKLKVYTE